MILEAVELLQVERRQLLLEFLTCSLPFRKSSSNLVDFIMKLGSSGSQKKWENPSLKQRAELCQIMMMSKKAFSSRFFPTFTFFFTTQFQYENAFSLYRPEEKKLQVEIKIVLYFDGCAILKKSSMNK